MARLGPRFALEAGFLLLVAALAGFGGLSWRVIVLLMGVAWALVAVHEYARWRAGPGPPIPPGRAGPVRAPVGSSRTDELTRAMRREPSVLDPWPERHEPPAAPDRPRPGGKPRL
jgi:hypothetical protein